MLPFPFSIFLARMGWKMPASKSWHLSSRFKPENGNVVPIVYFSLFPTSTVVIQICEMCIYAVFLDYQYVSHCLIKVIIDTATRRLLWLNLTVKVM